MSAVGFHGQYVAVFPTQRLVIVRLGLTRFPEVESFDRESFFADVLACFE